MSLNDEFTDPKRCSHLRFFLDLKSTKESGKASLVSEIILLGGVSPYGTVLNNSASHFHGSLLGLSASFQG